MKNLLIFMLGILFLSTLSFDLAAQNEYAKVENLKDEVDDLEVKILGFLDEHPNVSYEYVYSGDNVEDVKITGIVDEAEKEKLEGWLMEIDETNKKLSKKANRQGIYYAPDRSAEPEIGYNDLYTFLNSKLEYPEEAKTDGAEGMVYVKFIVNENGEINYIVAKHDIEGYDRQYVEEFVNEAKDAIESTSGKWNPAIVDGEKVPSWVSVPVQFKFEYNPSIRPLTVTQ